MLKSRGVVFAVVLLCFVAVGVWAVAAKTMSVQMKVSELRSTPSGLGRVVATVKLGDQLTILEEKGAWTRVSSESGAVGWIPTSSLTRGKIKMSSGGADARVAASNDEMALATKGFTSQVEADFKNQHKDIDFTWVDKMIDMKVSTGEMKKFLDQGGVKTAEGGAQ